MAGLTGRTQREALGRGAAAGAVCSCLLALWLSAAAAQSRMPRIDLPGPGGNQVIPDVPPNPPALPSAPQQPDVRPPQGAQQHPSPICRVPSRNMSADLRAYCAAQPH